MSCIATAAGADFTIPVGALEVTSDPSGASVYLDGTYQGVTGTPQMTDLTVTTGDHALRLSLSGYRDDVRTVTVVEGEGTRVHVILVPITQAPVTTGSLTLSTSPTGAIVILDGVNRGTTPLTLSGVEAGSHAARFSLSGYQDQAETVMVIAGQPNAYSFTLSPLAAAPTTGTLAIQSQPAGALVVLDSVNQGTTPATITGLTPGSHALRLTLTGYQDHIQQVSVIAGQTTTYEIPLQVQQGSSSGQPAAGQTTGDLEVTTVPGGATVTLDGISQGVTPLTVPASLTLTGLPAGSHSITLSLEGYQDHSQTVIVTAGQVTPYEFLLAQAAGPGPVNASVPEIPPVSLERRLPITPFPKTSGPTPGPLDYAFPQTVHIAPNVFATRVGDITQRSFLTSMNPNARYLEYFHKRIHTALAVCNGHCEHAGQQGYPAELAPRYGSTVEINWDYAREYGNDWWFGWASSNDIYNVQTATHGIWQVSEFPFYSGEQDWTRPMGLVAMGRVEKLPNNQTKYFAIDMSKVVDHRSFDTPYVDPSGRPCGFQFSGRYPLDPEVLASLPGAGPVTLTQTGEETGTLSLPAPGTHMNFNYRGISLGMLDLPLPVWAYLGEPPARVITPMEAAFQRPSAQHYYVRIVPVNEKCEKVGDPSLDVVMGITRNTILDPLAQQASATPSGTTLGVCVGISNSDVNGGVGCTGEFAGRSKYANNATGDWAVISQPREGGIVKDFRWSAPNAPAATGAIWQVSRFPFSSSVLDWENPPEGLADEGIVPAADFHIDFSPIVQPGIPDQTYYVRVVPVNGALLPVGDPSPPVEIHFTNVGGEPPAPYWPVETCKVLPTVYLKQPVILSTSYAKVNPYFQNAYGMSRNPEFPFPYAHWVIRDGVAMCAAGGDSEDFWDLFGLEPPDDPEDPAECARYTGMHVIVREPEVDDSFWGQLKALWDGILGMLASAINWTSQAWEDLKYGVSDTVCSYDVPQSWVTSIFGWSHEQCIDYQTYAGEQVMAAYGIPAHLPNYADYTNMGKEYLAQSTAESLEEKSGIPATATKPFIQERITWCAQKIGLEGEAATAMHFGSSWLIPDMDYMPHPAWVTVVVTNPGNENTDYSWIHVSDSLDSRTIPDATWTGEVHFFKPRDIPVPPIRPGQTLTIPVFLEEDIDWWEQTYPSRHPRMPTLQGEMTSEGWQSYNTQWCDTWQASYKPGEVNSLFDCRDADGIFGHSTSAVYEWLEFLKKGGQVTVRMSTPCTGCEAAEAAHGPDCYTMHVQPGYESPDSQARPAYGNWGDAGVYSQSVLSVPNFYQDVGSTADNVNIWASMNALPANQLPVAYKKYTWDRNEGKIYGEEDGILGMGYDNKVGWLSTGWMYVDVRSLSGPVSKATLQMHVKNIVHRVDGQTLPVDHPEDEMSIRVIDSPFSPDFVNGMGLGPHMKDTGYPGLYDHIMINGNYNLKSYDPGSKILTFDITQPVNNWISNKNEYGEDMAAYEEQKEQCNFVRNPTAEPFHGCPRDVESYYPELLFIGRQESASNPENYYLMEFDKISVTFEP